MERFRDKDTWVESIQKYAEEKLGVLYTKSPLRDKSVVYSLIEEGLKYGVNPIFMLGIFFAESTFGVNGVAVETKSMGNITAKTYNDILLDGRKNTCGNDYCRKDISVYHSDRTGRDYRRYNRWEDGIKDMAERLSRHMYSNLSGIDEICNKWVGGKNGNYISTVKQTMRHFLQEDVYLKASVSGDVQTSSLNGKRVFLSAGHSKTESGAVNYERGIREADVNMGIRDVCSRELRRLGCEVVEPPDNFSLVQTISWINTRTNKNWTDNKEEIAIEIHCNSNTNVSGTEAFFYTGCDVCKDLAVLLSKVNSKNLGITNRGGKPDSWSRYGRFGFVRDTKPLAILVEMGFMGGDIDVVTNYELCGRSLAEGIAKWFGYEEEIEPTPEPPEEPSPEPLSGYKFIRQTPVVLSGKNFILSVEGINGMEDSEIEFAWFVRKDPNIDNHFLVDGEENTSVLWDEERWVSKNQITSWNKETPSTSTRNKRILGNEYYN